MVYVLLTTMMKQAADFDKYVNSHVTYISYAGRGVAMVCENQRSRLQFRHNLGLTLDNQSMQAGL